MSLTLAGRQAFLGALFRAETLTLYAGLATAVPADSLSLSDITEPTIGANGYSRILLTVGTTDFATTGLINGEPFVDTRDLVWTATGGNFDQAITRVFLTPEQTATTGTVYGISAALSSPRVITPTTLAADRTFRFRNVLR